MLRRRKPTYQVSPVSVYSSLLAVSLLQLLWAQAIHMIPMLEILTRQCIYRRGSIKGAIAQAIPLEPVSARTLGGNIAPDTQALAHFALAEAQSQVGNL